MAYNPTTWTTGDTITATAMNKIENGIANAGGGNPVIKMVASNFSASTHICGEFLLCTLNNGVYYPAAVFIPSCGVVTAGQGEIVLYENMTLFITTFPATADNGNYVLIFAEGSVNYSFSGNISQEQVTIYNHAGSGHIVTGDCTIVMTE